SESSADASSFRSNCIVYLLAGLARSTAPCPSAIAHEYHRRLRRSRRSRPSEDRTRGSTRGASQLVPPLSPYRLGSRRSGLLAGLAISPTAGRAPAVRARAPRQRGPPRRRAAAEE